MGGMSNESDAGSSDMFAALSSGEYGGVSGRSTTLDTGEYDGDEKLEPGNAWVNLGQCRIRS